jgi:hypothetical protein
MSFNPRTGFTSEARANDQPDQFWMGLFGPAAAHASFVSVAHHFHRRAERILFCGCSLQKGHGQGRVHQSYRSLCRIAGYGGQCGRYFFRRFDARNEPAETNLHRGACASKCVLRRPFLRARMTLQTPLRALPKGTFHLLLRQAPRTSHRFAFAGHQMISGSIAVKLNSSPPARRV